MLKRTLVYLVLLLPIGAFGQYDFLLSEKDWDRMAYLDSLRIELLQIDYKDARGEVEKIKTLAVQNKDKKLELEAELLFVYIAKKNEPVDLQRVAEMAKKQKMFGIKERAIKLLGDYYWETVINYELAFENYLKADMLLQEMNPDSFLYWVRHCAAIGLRYYHFKDYDVAIKYLKQATEASVNSFNWREYWSAYNDLGICFQKKNLLDSANYYFLKALDSPFITEDNIRYTISRGNIGYTHYLKKEYEKAYPIIEADFVNAMNNSEEEDPGLAAGAAIPMADILIEKGDYKKAKQMLETARVYIEESGQRRRLVKYYPVAGKWHLKQKDFEKAMFYKDSTVSAIENTNKKFDALVLLRAEQKIHQQKIKLEEERNRLNQKISRTRLQLFILIFTILLAISVLLIYLQQQKHKKQKQEVKQARKRLLELTQSITQKSKLIEQLQKIKHSEENKQVIDGIKQKSILTISDWASFKQNFKSVHANFFQNVRSVEGITQSEVRILCLAKLKLSYSEMGTILGVSPESSRVTWHRFKKKHLLDKEITLKEYVDGLE